MSRNLQCADNFKVEVEAEESAPVEAMSWRGGPGVGS